MVPDTTAPTTTCSVDSGYYTTAQDVSLFQSEAGTTYYTINGGATQVYNNPLHLITDAELIFWTVDIYANAEAPQYRSYVVDLNPLIVSVTPKNGTYKTVKLQFIKNKPGQVFYSINGGPYVEYLSPVTISDKVLILLSKLDPTLPCQLVYSINGGAWLNYTELFEVNVGTNVRVAIKDDTDQLIDIKSYQY
jgi:hypothetical protein